MNGQRLRELLPGVPLVESPFFDEVVATANLDPETLRIARELHEKGYAVLKFPDADFAARAERIKRDLTPQLDFAGWRAHGWASNNGIRVQDAWKSHADVKAIACNQRVLKILSDVFGRRAWPFQTLNFPVGTQQHFHSDSVHFSSIPEKFMCGVWVALEDISQDAGPLEYYPGSHKWPVLYNDQIGVLMTGSHEAASQHLYEEVWRALVEKRGLEPEHFLPKRGEALIWAANLLHGGSRQSNPEITRWSQVTHYYFDHCCYVTPMASDVMIGQLYLRDMVDITTGRHMPNIYLGRNIAELVGAEHGNIPVRLPDDFDPQRYLALNPDVKTAGVDPAQHYLNYGAYEHRRYK
jgi:hypothetical protein